MAATKAKSSPKLLTAGRWRFSWRRMLITTSITLNIGFLVIWISLATTNSLDGLFMADGLDRYCSSANDDKFTSATLQVKAMRDYVCNSNDAHQYFSEGYYKYLDSKGISHPTN